MISVLGALAVGGVVGYLAKDKISTSVSTGETKQHTQEIDQLYNENEKLVKRNKELERENEDLLVEIQKVRRNAKKEVNDADDIEDKLDSAQREIKSLRQQNEILTAKLREYKNACENLEIQITSLKSEK